MCVWAGEIEESQDGQKSRAREIRTKAGRKREGWRNKGQQADQIGGGREIEKKRESECCVSLIKERTGYKPKQSGRLGHMFSITSDWHQTLKSSRPQACKTCNWFVPFPSPWADFIFAFALLLTLLGPPFLFNPLSSLLFASLISCISISQSFSASPEGALMTSEERSQRV